MNFWKNINTTGKWQITSIQKNVQEQFVAKASGKGTKQSDNINPAQNKMGVEKFKNED